MKNLNGAPDLFAVPSWQVEPGANGLRSALVRITLHEDEMQQLLAYSERLGIKPHGVVAAAVGDYLKSRVPEPESKLLPEDELEEPRPVEFDDRLAAHLETRGGQP